MKKIILYTVILVSVSACKEHKQEKQEKKQFSLNDTTYQMIALDTVRECNMDEELTLAGIIGFNENSVVAVVPRNSGQVTNCTISLGDKVQKGQLLATVQSADVAGDYADLSGAEADLQLAKRNFDNTTSLYNNGIASEKDMEEARENYNKAAALKQKISSLLNVNTGASNRPGDMYAVTSPIDGFIVEKNINTGNFIRPDMGDNLFTISSLKQVWVWANVFEKDIPRLKLNEPVTVTTLAYPDKVFYGKIDNMGQVLDPVSRVLKIRIQLDNSDLLLKPQMFAEVHINNSQPQKAICIPTNALIAMDSKNYVVVYKTRSDMKIAEVNVIKTTGDKTYISDGVAAGDKVITKNELLIFQQLSGE